MQNDSLKGLVGWSGGQKKGGHTSSFKLFDRSQNFKMKEKQGEGGHSIVKKCSIYLIETMKRCNQEFKFDQSLIPRRFLTVPNEGVSNNNYDNEQSDYIMRVKDIIYNDQRKIEYIIEDMLGKGTFGQVAKCSKNGTSDLFAVKVIKNRPAYFQQAKNEILLLRVLNKQEESCGDNYQKRIVNLVDFFVFRNHFCLVFEMLELSLYDYLKNTKFCGFSFSVIAQWTKSILEGMVIAESKQIIHCDLKPENIMLKNNQLKIIDFGSACHQDKRIFTYIQSRFYRAPEVILGMIYTTAIDMWSLGCILVELFLGLPIFPGNSEYDQIKRIIDILGKPSNEVIEQGRFKSKFFKLIDGEYVFKTKQEFEISERIQLKESKTYFQVNCLNDLKNYMYNSQFRRNEDDSKNNKQFDLFLDLATQLLELNPRKRIKATTAILHPFLNQDESNFYSSLTSQKIENTREFSLDQSTSDERQHDGKQQPQQNNQNTDFNLFKISDQNAAITKKAIQKQKENSDKLKPNQLSSDHQQQQITNLLSGQQQLGQDQSQYQYMNQFVPQQQQGQYQAEHYSLAPQQPGIPQIPFNQPYQQQPQLYNPFLNQQMYQFPYQFQQQGYPQMLPQQQQIIQQQTFPYQQPYNQQQQISQDNLANLFSQQLNLQTSNQFYNQKPSHKNFKQTKKCLSQQDSLDYQNEFYDDYSNSFQNDADKNMWQTNKFANNQNQSNFHKNSGYNYQKTGFNQGFQQGISNIENVQDQQAPPATIKDIFDNVDDNFPKQQINQQTQPQLQQQQQFYQQGNQQQLQFNQQYFQNMQNYYNAQQQMGVAGVGFQPNSGAQLPAQFQVQDQNQQQAFQLFQQQFNQQNYGFNQFGFQPRQSSQTFNQNQNNLQLNQYMQNQQYFQQQPIQQQLQQQPQNQQTSQIPQQQQPSQQQSYYNKPYSNQKQNNKYKNSANGKNSNNNTRQGQNESNSNNNNNSQKFYQNNKKFRRHYSDSEFQQYQPEQTEIFSDIKAPFIESDQIENQSQNFGKSGESLKDDNQQERYVEESTPNNSSNYSNHNNSIGNQKQNQNYKKQNSNYNNNQTYSNQKNQQKFKKGNNQNQGQQHNYNFNSNTNNNNNNNNFSQNFPNQNTQFQANLGNNNNNISNNNTNTNSNNSSQTQTQNMKTSQQSNNSNNNNSNTNNNNSVNSNDQQNQHLSQDSSNNNKKGQTKFKNQNQNKKNYPNQKYQQQNAQQQQFQQGQKQFSPINESPSQS